MHYIEKSGSSFEILNYPWDENGYKPKTVVTIGYDDGGYNVHFVSYDTDRRAVETEHNTPVCQDSCMELFMQFDPKNDIRYMQFEINPNGAVYSSVSECREITEKIDPNIIDTLGVKTSVYDDRWEITYYIPKEYIQRFIPTYVHKTGTVIRGNFYKCAEKNNFPHFGCFNNINWMPPDFHRPEFFTEFTLI